MKRLPSVFIDSYANPSRYTLSAIQILVTLDELSEDVIEKTATFVAGLQQEDGSFQGDQWGETETRFSFCAVACLSLLGRLDLVDSERAKGYVLRCMNYDGGFGTQPGSETHAGQIYCCLGTLSILGGLHCVDEDNLGWWLCQRQLESGGLNGRPEKLPDVCYSWWVLTSLAILDKVDWISDERLRRYILASQDHEDGGIADRPGDMCDPFHTLFGVAGLSLLGDEHLKPVNPVYCMPQEVIDRSRVQRATNRV